MAAKIFDIELCPTANQTAIDGKFQRGGLDGRTVNIKFYTKNDGLLDLKKKKKDGPDYYLVMTGPKSKAESSRGTTRPWVIESVFLFDAGVLVRELKALNPTKKIGVATGVPVDLWKKAMIYPNGVSPLLSITDSQRERLALFATDAVG